MPNLIAYVPVLNRQYLEWIGSHVDSKLFLIEQSMAESLLPRLARNMGALSSQTIAHLIRAEYPFMQVFFSFHPGGLSLPEWATCVMPNEDVCHALAEKHLEPMGCKVTFEPIRARHDMLDVKQREPIIPDLEVSSEEIDRIRMDMADKLIPRSPDWWRQIAACAFKDGQQIACSYNAHFPNEYETVMFGDTRLNFDAGDPSGFEAYISLHAEKGIVTACARKGVALEGASVYVTTFPCGDCARMLADCHIKELFFSEGYSVLKGLETLRSRSIRIVKVLSPKET